MNSGIDRFIDDRDESPYNNNTRNTALNNKSVKLIGLNVCGLRSKLRNGLQ